MIYAGKYGTTAYGAVTDKSIFSFIRNVGVMLGLNKDNNTNMGTRKAIQVGKNSDTNTTVGTRKT